MSMRCIIAGGRDFCDWITAKKKLDTIFKNGLPDIIISGRCFAPKDGVCTFTTDDGIDVYGADGLGEKYAQEKYIKVYPYPADFDELGNSAGPIRNKIMAQAATHCVIFWNGKSRGSKSMKELSEKFNLPTRIIRY